MNAASSQRVKVALGLLLGFGIGAFCRWQGIPSPAPPVFAGAMLVVAMTLGYSGTDRWLGLARAKHAHLCGGPDGSIKADS